jgi:hypothetical protein
MMEVVSENEEQQHPSPPALRPPSEPAPLDPEHVRQFQQFQEFQELMRQHGDLPPMLRPPAKKPLWKKILRSKLVRRLIYLLIILLLLSWAYQHYFGNPNENLPASITGGGLYHTNHILKDNPYAAVRQVYLRIADDSPPFACGVFTDEAAQQFAQHFNAADCPHAIDLLNKQIDRSPGAGGVDAYSNPDFHGKMGEKPDSGTATISSCELGVTAGPRLGAFTVSRVENGQWIITAHQIERC